MRTENNTSFIAGLIGQEESAVAQLLDQYWVRAYRVAYQLVGDSGAAEDVAQETFVAVLKKI
ncbi:MAG: sigma factor, partial [Planctomycetota bacterium]|nr:sigma factor [Planctomycetota bacterium]